MGRFKRHIYLIVLALAGALASCEGVIDHTRPLCDYTVQLRYDYNQENTATDNQYPRYVRSAEEYIFDEAGILYATGSVAADPCTGEWVSELDLPPGRYSVIVVGNRTSMSRTHHNGNTPKIGLTRREEMTLTLENRSANGSDNGTHFNSTGRLYYGYRTFTIAENQISNVRVDMVHSHLDLMYTIRWKNNKAPANTNDFYIQLNDVPSEYNLMPEYVYPQAFGACEQYNGSLHDEYKSDNPAVRQHIAQVSRDRNVVSHRQRATMFGNVISGQTITYRIRNTVPGCTETTISLWRGNATRAGEPEELMKEIPLNDFLNRSYVDLDRTLKQQYHIVFEVDGDTRQVSAWFAEIADWDEGGNLGG